MQWEQMVRFLNVTEAAHEVDDAENWGGGALNRHMYHQKKKYC